MTIDANRPASSPSLALPVVADPKVHGESAYDRVTSLLMSLVIGAGLIAGFLYLIFVTNQVYARNVPTPIVIVEVSDGEGGAPGSLKGAEGQSESVDYGVPPADQASNNSAEDAGDYQAQVESGTVPTVIDGGDNPTDPDDNLVEIGNTSGGPNPSGKRASRLGTGPIGFGTGGKGGNGVSVENRWVIVYPDGQPADEYAKQLDAFGIELVTFATNKSVVIASKFSSGEPLKRSMMTSTFNKQRPPKLYFILFAGSSRRAADVELLKRAKIDPDGKPILQVYPKEIQDRLAQLEVAKNGWQPSQIQKTYFSVFRSGNTWDFRVDSQEPRTAPAAK